MRVTYFIEPLFGCLYPRPEHRASRQMVLAKQSLMWRSSTIENRSLIRHRIDH